MSDPKHLRFPVVDEVSTMPVPRVGAEARKEDKVKPFGTGALEDRVQRAARRAVR